MSEYLLAGDDELARLQLQARVWEPAAEALLDEIGVQPGWRCLDLGCGAMGILGPLRRRVGEQGQVAGFDADDKMLAAAHHYAEIEGLDKIELHQGNALETGLPSASFDLVHARFLFPHVAEPSNLLREMMRLTQGGGMVAAEEPDHSSWHFYPPCAAWEELLPLLEKALAMRGDINFGRRLYTLFRDSELAEVQVRAAVVALQDSHPYMRMALVAAEAMRPLMVKAGLATEAKLDELLAAVEACAADPARMMVTFTTAQVWGRKPEEK